MSWSRSAAAAVLIQVMAAPAAAQHLGLTGGSGSAAGFLARAREATARYQDRAAAVADGFRALGPDAPAMGEHWIHPGRVLSGVFDPERPAGLTYIMVGGHPVLAGVFYVLPLEPGARPPAEPAGPGAWHFHNADFSEEALLSAHDSSESHDAPGLRIAVLHAWAWVENPEGPFVPENWLLPFVRLGLVPGKPAPSAAAKAISLATAEGRAFFASRIDLSAGRRLPELEQVLSTQGERVLRRITGSQAGAPRLSPDDMRWLAASWEIALQDLQAAAPAPERALVRRVLGDGVP